MSTRALIFHLVGCVFAIIYVLNSGLAAAHDLSRSESHLEVHEARVEGWHLIDPLEFPDLRADTNGDGKLSYDELDAVLPRLYETFKQHLRIGAPAPPVRIQINDYAIVNDQFLRLNVTYTFSAPIRQLTLELTLPEVTRPQHVHLAAVRMNDEVHEAIFDSEHTSVTFNPGGVRWYKILTQFVGLGVEHILTGYDHLAFVLCLVVAATTVRGLVGVVTSFTLAHSITLALGAFDLVSVPTRISETCIALSIAYVAMENLLEIRTVQRYGVTFAFGLLHGFGFSNVLHEMELPREALALSLLSFNIGVELGQLAFIAVAFPLLGVVAAKRMDIVRPLLSAAVVAVGTFWSVQRAFFG